METTTNEINTIIIGASAAGLSCGVCLQREGIPFIILEGSARIGNEWKNRYDRLHLHTTKRHSALPYFKMPGHFPKYLSRNDFEKYLNDYAEEFHIHPVFNREVLQVEREGNLWSVSTESETLQSKNIIVATGYARKPVHASGDGLRNFRGEIIHSSHYRNGQAYKNKKVLVIGFGNSACEIAMCLHEHGAFPSISVRNKVNIIPRDIAGISSVDIAVAQRWMIKISPSLTDKLNKPLLRFLNGDLSKYGLHPAEYGPFTQIIKYKRIPLLDIGTLDLIRLGKIKVHPAIVKATNDSVLFIDGQEERFDAIISATGYLPRVADFIKDSGKVCDSEGTPLTSGSESELSGLYFCGFKISPTGMLREIALEAKQIAGHLKANHS